MRSCRRAFLYRNAAILQNYDKNKQDIRISGLSCYFRSRLGKNFPPDLFPGRVCAFPVCAKIKTGQRETFPLSGRRFVCLQVLLFCGAPQPFCSYFAIVPAIVCGFPTVRSRSPPDCRIPDRGLPMARSGNGQIVSTRKCLRSQEPSLHPAI